MSDNRTLHRWSQRDANLVGLWLMLLASGFFWPVMIAVAFAVAVVFGTWLAVRQALRHRRWHAEPPPEFWIERIKE
jgi:disulfide bond formation protein DsbB